MQVSQVACSVVRVQLVPFSPPGRVFGSCWIWLINQNPPDLQGCMPTSSPSLHVQPGLRCPRSRIWHLCSLNFIRLVIDQHSHLSRYPCKASLPSRKSAFSSNLASHINLVCTQLLCWGDDVFVCYFLFKLLFG